MLDKDAICEPVNPLWNIEAEYNAFIAKNGIKPRDDEEVRLIARAIREERKGDELKELKRRLKDPEAYRAKSRRNWERRKQRHNVMKS
jgi:hypothetical protein